MKMSGGDPIPVHFIQCVMEWRDWSRLDGIQKTKSCNEMKAIQPVLFH